MEDSVVAGKKIKVFAVVCLSVLMAGCASTQKITQELEEKYTAMTAEEILSAMTTEEKVAQLFVIRPEQLDLKSDGEKKGSFSKSSYTKLKSHMKEALWQYPVGGVCIFKKNIKSKNQLKKLNRGIKENSAVRPLLTVDEEGGRIARLARTESFKLTNVGPMGEIGASGDREKAREAGQYIGSYLSEYSFNLDFAPVVDVNTNPENIVIGDRAFGSDPAMVSDMASAFLDGLHSAGIMGCIKHFPGHGDTKGDTHDDYVAVDKTWEELLACELIPYKENLSKADSVMIAHVTMAKVTSDGLPASLSKEIVTDRLRKELGYEGVILTDSLSMGAIGKNYGSEKAALLAFLAGNDILLLPRDFPAAYNAMLSAVSTGEIPMERIDESVLRILKLKGY